MAVKASSMIPSASRWMILSVKTAGVLVRDSWACEHSRFRFPQALSESAKRALQHSSLDPCSSPDRPDRHGNVNLAAFKAISSFCRIAAKKKLAGSWLSFSIASCLSLSALEIVVLDDASREANVNKSTREFHGVTPQPNLLSDMPTSSCANTVSHCSKLTQPRQQTLMKAFL